MEKFCLAFALRNAVDFLNPMWATMIASNLSSMGYGLEPQTAVDWRQ
jgi:hypothetical protein